ncbi:MAG: biosynthetic-type acetolactate synthase large subunit [Clostridiaceae bacterium]
MLINGARILLECLKEQGVDTIFGYPGGAVLNIYDELYSFESIKHILTSHEQGACHAADGYARATGKVGVVLATSGPGATNLVTGIANAYMDSIPLVAITGQVGTNLIGKDSFQEVDIVGITMPITKHNFIVKKIEDLAPTIRKAFEIARKGRPGPVLVDIPKDITATKMEFIAEVIDTEVKHNEVDKTEIEKAIEVINNSKRPLMMLGGGCISSDSTVEVAELQRKLKCPVTTTMMGIGAFDGTNPMYSGAVGMHGTVSSNKFVGESDLIITIGARFSDRVISNARTFAKDVHILHIDIDAAEISKNIIAHSYVVGDVKASLEKINEKIVARDDNQWSQYALDTINSYKEKRSLSVKTNDDIHPIFVMNKIYEITGGDAVISTEVGQNQIWAFQGFTYTKPRTYISSCGLGTMGYGLGACMGASVGLQRPVFNIAGDGSFLMNINELNTAVKYNIPVKIILFNNSVLGMVRQWQDLFYEKRFSQTILSTETDFTAIGKAFGVFSTRITENSQVEDAIKAALDYDGPALIECIIDKELKATPIVPPGASINEMLLTD